MRNPRMQRRWMRRMARQADAARREPGAPSPVEGDAAADESREGLTFRSTDRPVPRQRPVRSRPNLWF